MSAPSTMEGPEPRAKDPLADPELRRFLLDYVRRRVSPADADDIVQTVLCEALTAKQRPEDGTELRKYLLGIAKHKLVDQHRRASREVAGDPPELSAAPPPVEEEALLRWAERQAPETDEAKKTLTWMAREGEGEKLENIAAEEQVPAARVRQRVSRMRRWMKERWLAELAAVAALAVLAFVLYRIFRTADDIEAIRPDPEPTPSASPPETPLERARALRAEALRRCAAGEHQPCLDGLDAAKALDPTGDDTPEVRAARDVARRALETPPPPPTTDTNTDAKTPTKAEVPAPKQVAPKPVAPKPVAPKVEDPYGKPTPKNAPKQTKQKLDEKELFLKK